MIEFKFNVFCVVLVAGFSIVAFSAHSAENKAVVPLPISMGNSLSFDANPSSLNLGGLGIWRISPVMSGFTYSQTNPSGGAGDLSNAQLLIQKISGDFQFFIQTGLYAVPTLGEPIARSFSNTVDTYGYVPNASISYSINSNWSITAGKSASMGGYESMMTYQNLNIQRGLLWGQTSAVSTGATVNYSVGNMSFAVTWNDGFDSDKMNWLGASGTYQLNNKENVTFSWVGPTSGNAQNTDNTPLLQNNSQIFNAIYTYTGDRWFIAPYLQYTVVSKNESISIASQYQTYGVALLTNYRFPDVHWQGIGQAKVSLPFRVEYIQEHGGNQGDPSSMLYGPNSSAVSLTLTPTIQVDQYFARIEGSLVQISQAQPGLGLGSSGTKASQYRIMLEVGVLF
jgi:hypothetical protein